MAKATLPTNYQDDILKSSMNGKRRYTFTDNSDGTKSLEDATQYDKVGSNFGAADMNKTNAAVNAAADASKIIDSLSTIASTTQAGYMAGALAVKELNQNLNGVKIIPEGSGAATKYYAQQGADTASKKLLGNSDIYIARAYTVNGGSFNIPVISGYKVALAGVVGSCLTSLSTATYIINNNGLTCSGTHSGGTCTIMVYYVKEGYEDMIHILSYADGYEWAISQRNGYTFVGAVVKITFTVSSTTSYVYLTPNSTGTTYTLATIAGNNSGISVSSHYITGFYVRN